MKTRHIFFLSAAVLLSLAGCQDDEYIIAPGADFGANSRALSPGSTSALTTTNGGATWTATRRVPLVGMGREVNNMPGNLVNVLDVSPGSLNNIVDLDLTNSGTVAGLVSVDVTKKYISVRDMYRTYAGGQKAGFVCQVPGGGVLGLNLLAGYYLKTYLKGEPTGDRIVIDSNSSGLLGLNLLGGTDGESIVSMDATFGNAFDEIELGKDGVDVGAATPIQVFYAYVGENVTQPATTDNAYFTNDPVASTPSALLVPAFISIDNLTDPNLTNYATANPVGGVLGLLGGINATVNFGQEIPAGYEVGFYLSTGGVLGVDLLGTTTISTLDSSGDEVESSISGGLLGVSALGGSGLNQVSMVLTEPANQVKVAWTGVNVGTLLGGTRVYYAFVRPETKIDASSYFWVPDDETNSNSYKLPTPTTGTVSYSVTDANGNPAKVSSNNTITGMTPGGVYHVTAAYNNGNGEIVNLTATITCTSGDDNCINIITTEDYGATVYGPTGGVCLICLGTGTDVKGVNALVDNDPNNYTSFSNLLTLLQGNTSIAGIKTTKPISTGGPKRAGFVIQPSSSLLGLNALDNFQIRLLNNGVLVDQGTAAGDGANAVSLGLLSGGSKIRMAIETDAEFNQIELWTAGVLGLDLNNLKVFYPYWEEADANCGDDGLSGTCLQPMTPTSYGAYINTDKTGAVGVANVATTFNDLSNVIDGDLNTYATIVTTVGAVGTNVIAVKFPPINQKQAVGFIVKAPTELGQIDLLTAAQVKVYYQGTQVGGDSDLDLLNVDLIGDGSNIYYETTPESVPFDEVRIEFTDVLNVSLGGKTMVGDIFIRPDANADGIPDCAEVPESTSEVIDIIASNSPVLVENPIELTLSGATENADYILKFYDANTGAEIPGLAQTVTLTDSKLTIPTGRDGGTEVPVGSYYVSIYDASGTTELYNREPVIVYSTETTWTGNESTDWNDPDNWTEGVPQAETNVIIPSDAPRYPELDGDGPYESKNIYFEPGAEVVNTPKLDYEQAYVDTELDPDRYYMMSPALKNTYSGDMFVLTTNLPIFTPLNEANVPNVNRTNPRVYQRLWSHDAIGQKMGGTITVVPDETNWSPDFNYVAEEYKPGMGFSIRLDGAGVIRLPKLHLKYIYFNPNGGALKPNQTIPRKAGMNGRFIYEDDNGNTTWPVSITATNKAAGDTYLVGNPFMSHINIEKFQSQNPGITSIKVYNGTGNNSAISITGDGFVTNDGTALTDIAPMQSFFVTMNTAGTSQVFKFTEDMLTQAQGQMMRSTRSGAPSVSNALRVTASVGNASSNCLIRISASASTSYRAGEDAKLLFDNEVRPAIAIFSVADEKALDIQQLASSATRIPLGMSMKNPARVTLKFAHQSGNTWQNWSLVDTETGKRTSLQNAEVTLDAGILKSNVGRFYLEKN